MRKKSRETKAALTSSSRAFLEIAYCRIDFVFPDKAPPDNYRDEKQKAALTNSRGLDLTCSFLFYS